jgi:hypothetical protein
MWIENLQFDIHRRAQAGFFATAGDRQHKRHSQQDEDARGDGEFRFVGTAMHRAPFPSGARGRPGGLSDQRSGPHHDDADAEINGQ